MKRKYIFDCDYFVRDDLMASRRSIKWRAHWRPIRHASMDRGEAIENIHLVLHVFILSIQFNFLDIYSSFFFIDICKLEIVINIL